MKKLEAYSILFWAIFVAMALGGFAMIMVALGFMAL